MRKYFILFKQVFSQFSSYRLHVIANIGQNFILPVITILALSQASSISGVQVSSMVNYYLLILLFLPILNVNTQDYMSNLTFTGEINNFLMKPISLYKWLITKELSEKLVSFVVFFPIAAILLAVFLGRNDASLDLIVLIRVLCVTMFCFVLSFNLAFFVGIFSFWIDEFWTVSNIKSVAVLLLGGVALPYSLFPQEVYQVLQFTFFPYLVSWPVKVLGSGIQLFEIGVAFSWLVFSFICINAFLRKAINKYSFTAN